MNLISNYILLFVFRVSFFFTACIACPLTLFLLVHYGGSLQYICQKQMGMCSSSHHNHNSNGRKINNDYGKYCKVKDLDELERKQEKRSLSKAIDKIYKQYDANKDGFLNFEEIRSILIVVLRRDSISDADVQAVVRLSKSSQAGRIHKSDFHNIYQTWQAINDKMQETKR